MIFPLLAVMPATRLDWITAARAAALAAGGQPFLTSGSRPGWRRSSGSAFSDPRPWPWPQPSSPCCGCAPPGPGRQPAASATSSSRPTPAARRPRPDERRRRGSQGPGGPVDGEIGGCRHRHERRPDVHAGDGWPDGGGGGPGELAGCACSTVLPLAPPWPPWSLHLDPSPLVVSAMLWLTELLGAGGLALGLAAVRRGWRPRARLLILGSVVAVTALTMIPSVDTGDTVQYAAFGRIAVLGHSPYVMTPGPAAVRRGPGRGRRAVHLLEPPLPLRPRRHRHRGRRVGTGRNLRRARHLLDESLERPGLPDPRPGPGPGRPLRPGPPRPRPPAVVTQPAHAPRPHGQRPQRRPRRRRRHHRHTRPAPRHHPPRPPGRHPPRPRHRPQGPVRPPRRRPGLDRTPVTPRRRPPWPSAPAPSWPPPTSWPAPPRSPPPPASPASHPSARGSPWPRFSAGST